VEIPNVASDPVREPTSPSRITSLSETAAPPEGLPGTLVSAGVGLDALVPGGGVGVPPLAPADGPGSLLFSQPRGKDPSVKISATEQPRIG
jgi:hypothetical protein